MIQECVNNIKRTLETVVRSACFDGRHYTSGVQAKEALIRSQRLINLLHEAVKKSINAFGIDASRIFPPIGQQSPEMKIAGFLKQKDQDICVIPSGITPSRRSIDWGPLRFEADAFDEYGQEYSERTLVINVRSQLSSVGKNTDTLFERTFAESVNLHKVYPQMVLGEVYMIPVFEYDDEAMKQNQIAFKRKHTNIEKYISFFTAINNRISASDDISKYEKVALLIVDFSKSNPVVYNNTNQLIQDRLVRPAFPLELNELAFENFIPTVMAQYEERFNRS